MAPSNKKRKETRKLQKANDALTTALSYYRAAEKNRLTADWQAKSRSADASFLPDRATVYARARDMAANNPHIRSIIRAYRRNIIGTGIVGTAAATKPDGELDIELNKKIDAVFYDWARNPNLVDRERRRNWVQIQHWVVSEYVQVGQALIILGYEERPRAVGGRRRSPGLVLQLVESEQLDMTKLEYQGRQVRGGVEVDECGAAVAYWIYKTHPYDYAGMAHISPLTLDSTRIPAGRVLHIYDPERARQTQGVSPLMPVLMAARDLEERDRSELIAARAESNIGVIIESPPEMNNVGVPGPDGSLGNSTADASASSANNYIGNYQSEPFTVARTAPGQKIVPYTPARASGSYMPFTMGQLRSMAAATGISYEQMIRDFSTTNYSGLRQANGEDRRENSVITEQLFWHLCQPIREEFIEICLLEGFLSIPDFHQYPERYTYTNWHPQRHESVDPKKDADAFETDYANGLTTLQIACAKNGTDWRENARQKAVEQATIIQMTQEELSKNPTPVPTPAPTPVPTPVPAPARIANSNGHSKPRRFQGTALSASESSVALRQGVGGLLGPIQVDREAGIIHGVAVITSGATLTDGIGNPPMMVDALTLAQVVSAINAKPAGVKSRMTHPEVDDVDGIDQIIGSVRNARVEGDRVLADVHIGAYAAYSPKGNMREYLLGLAEESPEAAGLSLLTTKMSLEQTNQGPTLRVQSIDAVDWTAKPASNPRGLLSSGSSLPTGKIKPAQPATNSGASIAKKDIVAMNEDQKSFLLDQGMPYDATDDQVAAFIEALSEDQKNQLAAIKDDPESDKIAAAVEDATGAQDAVSTAPAVTAQSAGTAKPVALVTPTSGDSGVDDRLTKIRNIAALAGFSSDWVLDQYENTNQSVDDINAVALAAKKKGMEPVNMTVTGGADLNKDSLQEAVKDAIALRAGAKLHKFESDGRTVMLSANNLPETRKPHERSNAFRNQSVIEIFKEYMIALGASGVKNMSRNDLAGLMLSRGQLQNRLQGVYLAHSTGDFPSLMADVMNKNLRAQYALAAPQWPKWTSQRTVPDFKDIKNIQLGASADLEQMEAGEEYTYGTMVEGKETYRVVKYGKGFAITREALINDDTSAFDRIQASQGRAVARMQDKETLAKLTGSATMADGHTLFHANHSNLGTGSGNVGAPSAATLDQAYASFMTQTELGSDAPLDLVPSFIVVPPSLLGSTKVLINSGVLAGAQNGVINPYEGQLGIISSGRLTGNAWYLLANPADMPTVEVATLEGESAPTIEEEENFNNDTIKFKVRNYFGTGLVDYRGAYKNEGA